MWIDEASLYPNSNSGARLFVPRRTNPELDLPARAEQLVLFCMEWKYQKGENFVSPLTN